MAVDASTQREGVTGRVWMVRLDPYGRPSAGAVKLSCSRPTCTDQRFPDGAATGPQGRHRPRQSASGSHPLGRRPP